MVLLVLKDRSLSLSLTLSLAHACEASVRPLTNTTGTVRDP